MKQSKASSTLEAVINVSVGYFISIVVTIYLLPLWGFEPSIRDAAEISIAYYIVSFIRSYGVRRAFNYTR